MRHKIHALALTFALLLVAGVTSSAMAQQSTPEPQAVPQEPSVARKDDEVVLTTGLGASVRHIFPRGQCTEYAATQFEGRTNQPITFGGHARDWLNNAARAGYTTGRGLQALTRDGIIVFGPLGRNPYGHVGIIEAILDGDKIEISEQNWRGVGIVSRRVIKISQLKSLNYQGCIFPVK